MKKQVKKSPPTMLARGDKKVSPLVTQLSWTHNLLTLSKSKRPEEREFYLRMATSQKWLSCELERQFNGALFERIVLSPAKVSATLTQLHVRVASVLEVVCSRAPFEEEPEIKARSVHYDSTKQLKLTENPA